MRALLGQIEPGMWATHSVLLFGCMFFAMVIWVYSPTRRSSYRQAAELPLKD